MKKYLKISGFTLIELLVVIAIISILAAVILANVGEGSAISRDAKRQADLRAIESALELYKNKNGRYPEGCNGPDNWSGQIDTTYKCPSGSQYIKGDLSATAEVESFAPEFLTVLPVDPRLNDANSGYVYTVNTDGTVYKMMVMNNVESKAVTLKDEFSRCGDTNSTLNECAAVPLSPGDAGLYNRTGNTPTQCNIVAQFSNDYAISAGYARGGNYLGSYLTTEKAREYFTDQIRCK